MSNIELSHTLVTSTNKQNLMDLKTGESIDKHIMQGYLNFMINGKDFAFSGKGNILGFSIDLVNCLSFAIFFDTVTILHFVDEDVKIQFKPNGEKIDIILSAADLTLQKTTTHLLDLVQTIGAFHNTILLETFKIHPELKQHEAFLEFCPFSRDIIHET